MRSFNEYITEKFQITKDSKIPKETFVFSGRKIKVKVTIPFVLNVISATMHNRITDTLTVYRCEYNNKLQRYILFDNNDTIVADSLDKWEIDVLFNLNDSIYTYVKYTDNDKIINSEVLMGINTEKTEYETL